jgi:hypothetical protein
MLRRCIACFLILALITANFSRLFIYAGFELNRNYIASKLCENRDKPWLHCGGRCYFVKKIKQAEEKDKSGERQTQKNLFQEAFCPAPAHLKFHAVLLRVMLLPNDVPALPQIPGTIFHPPPTAIFS